MRKHIGPNPQIRKSILESGNYHAVHDRLYEGMYRLFSNKNRVIMICRSGRHGSVANAELWSNTLTRCGRRQHSFSLLHFSELDFWGNTCAGKCLECSNQSSVTGPWKRPRPEHAGGPAQSVSTNLLRKTIFHKLQKKASDKCQSYTFQDWQSDSEAFMKGPVHWPVACRNATSPARQIRT